ncbi:MAG TPA: CopD family protein [Rhizomicrobium sp.]|jgi:putative copper resistance protein D
MSIALALARAAHLASLLILFGSESVQALFRAQIPNPPVIPLPASTPIWLAALALATAVLWFFLAAGMMADSAMPLGPAAIWTVAKDTLFGRVFLVRLALLALLLIVVIRWELHSLRIALVGAALVAIALTSHAAARGDPRFMLARAANDSLHLLAAGFWIGGLALLVPLVRVNRNTPKALLAPLQLFSSWGMAAVALLIVAGSINAWLILHGAPAGVSLAYAGLLAGKIVLASLMVALALSNRLGLLPELGKDPNASAASLISSTLAELILGLVIVLIVGFLGTMSPLMG